jgi:hypothetical protein
MPLIGERQTRCHHSRVEASHGLERRGSAGGRLPPSAVSVIQSREVRRR